MAHCGPCRSNTEYSQGASCRFEIRCQVLFGASGSHFGRWEEVVCGRGYLIPPAYAYPAEKRPLPALLRQRTYRDLASTRAFISV